MCCCEWYKLCPCCISCCRGDSGTAWGVVCGCIGMVFAILLSPILGILILGAILIGCLMFLASACCCCFCCGKMFDDDFQDYWFDVFDKWTHNCCCCCYKKDDYSV